MYIIVVGGGKIGYYLTKALLNEGHEVLLIERDARKCERIAEELGSVVMRGDGCEAATLADAGTERAGVVVAVTGDDEDNLVACQVAKAKFKVPRTVARINNPKNGIIFKKLGIDVTVSSTEVILSQIEHELPLHSLAHLLVLKGSGLEIVEVKIPDDSPAVGRALKDVSLPADSIISLIVSGGSAGIPSGDTVLRAGDEVLAVAKEESEEALRRALAGGPS